LAVGSDLPACLRYLKQKNEQERTKMKNMIPKNKIIAALAALALTGLSAFGQTSISASSFNLWETCGTGPYLESGGICVPVGSSCAPDYYGAQESSCQGTTGMQFYGCFKGGSTAPSSSDQEAVFVTDNVSTWTGHEMGFIKTLNNNALQYYIQGGGNYIYGTISTGDNGYHTFKCQCRSATDSDMVDFYLDGNYVATLTNPGSSYWENCCYMVGTTQNLSSGWSSSGEQIEMYDIEYF
jgi:hypothetical protein